MITIPSYVEFQTMVPKLIQYPKKKNKNTLVHKENDLGEDPIAQAKDCHFCSHEVAGSSRSTNRGKTCKGHMEASFLAREN